MSRINTAQIAVLPGTALDMYTLVRRRGHWNSSQREEQQHWATLRSHFFIHLLDQNLNKIYK